MAETKLVPIFGTKPPCAYESRYVEHIAKEEIEKLSWPNAPTNQEILLYESSDKEDDKMLKSSVVNTSYNFVDFARSREYGMKQYRSIKKYYGTRQMLTNGLFKERLLSSNSLNTMNKVLCSQWLSSKAIIMGTGCHKLMVYDVNSNVMKEIASIRGPVDEEVNQQSGIYSLKINSSRTLLATTAYNSHEIAVYKLPTFDPVALAQSALTQECIFDIEWLDDEFFVSGSKDGIFALWHVLNEYEDEYNDDGDIIKPVKTFISPKVTKFCAMDHDILAVRFSRHLNELISISSNGYFHVWDSTIITQKHTKKVGALEDSICMAMECDLGVFAVGCNRYTILLDLRTYSKIKCVPLRLNCHGIRSLSFEENIITIGTATGTIMFYDIRAHKFLDSKASGRKRLIVMKTTDGYVEHNEIRLPPVSYTSAINTHCYDHSGIRLFTGGGPLLDSIHGYYASIWQ